METIKKQIVAEIRKRALAEARLLAGEFARAASADREAILAQLEHERWLAEACDDALDEPI